MRDNDVKMIAVAAILIAAGVFLRTKKAISSQPKPGYFWDGYGFVKAGTPYEVTWG